MLFVVHVLFLFFLSFFLFFFFLVLEICIWTRHFINSPIIAVSALEYIFCFFSIYTFLRSRPCRIPMIENEQT